MSLEGKVAVITGAARGMGQAFAVALAREGVDVAAVDILDCSETLGMIEAEGRKGLAISRDISLPETALEVAQMVAEKLGPAHILVNNAGLHPQPTALEDLKFDYWRKVMAVNLDAMFLFIQAFLPQLRGHGWGRIVNISSSSANAAPPNGAPYVSSKAGVLGLTRAVATEVGKYDITCNAIAPNPVRTPGAEVIPEDAFQAVAAMQPIARVMEPKDVCGALVFLCGDGSEFITGQHIHVDGGFVRGD